MERKGTEFTVGLFVIAGLALIAGLIIYFGNFKEQFQSTYMLKVQFPNASGLIKGSTVKFMGAPVGSVVTAPRVISVDDGRLMVEMDVRIGDDIRIRRGSKWTIGSSGLLGDAYVEVQPLAPPRQGVEPTPFLQAGETVKGTPTAGIADLASTAEPVLAEAKKVMLQLQQISERLNNEYITSANAERISQTLDELNAVMAKVDSILGGVDPQTVHDILSRVSNITANVDKLFARAAGGDGVLYELLADRKTGVNLAAFIENIRKHGVLFYSDSSGLNEKEEGKAKNGKKKSTGPVLRELR